MTKCLPPRSPPPSLPPSLSSTQITPSVKVAAAYNYHDIVFFLLQIPEVVKAIDHTDVQVRARGERKQHAPLVTVRQLEYALLGLWVVRSHSSPPFHVYRATPIRIPHPNPLHSVRSLGPIWWLTPMLRRPPDLIFIVWFCVRLTRARQRCGGHGRW